MSSTPAPKPDIHVLIIGTGITGLVLAHGLQQVGVFYHVPIPKKKKPTFSISII
jgi:cation diffusion facilitator CzcD-associated flavoprotein CzcO